MRHPLLACLTLALSLTTATTALHADARSEYATALEQVKAKNWADAAQSFARVTALAPDYAQGWKQLATCRYYLGDVEGAEATAVRYLKLVPTDAAFAAWDGQLRTKLKLPPLDLAPKPAAAPVVVAPKEDAVLAAAPPPGADAETIASAAAAGANVATAAESAQPAAQAASPAEAKPQAATATEQVSFETQGSQAQSAQAEPAQEDRTPFKRVGLRLLGSFSLGLGKFAHGEDVNSSTTASGKQYSGQVALGLGGAGEFLYNLSRHWELSLGLYPLNWQETRRSSQTDTVTRSNESTANALFLPVLLGIGYRADLGGGLSTLFSLGLGAVPSAQVSIKSQTVQTTATGLSNSTVNSTYNFSTAPAWRLGAGLEVPVGSVVGIYLGGQLVGATFAPVLGTHNGETVDETGAVTNSFSGVSALSRDLTLMSASALAGLALHF